MTRLLENGRGRFTVEEPWVMLLQDVPDVFRHVIELKSGEFLTLSGAALLAAYGPQPTRG